MKETIPQIYYTHSRGEELYKKGFRFNLHGDLAMDGGRFVDKIDQDMDHAYSRRSNWIVEGHK